MATAYTWLSMYKNSVGKEQGMSVNEINGVFGKQASEMSRQFDSFPLIHIPSFKLNFTRFQKDMP